jgi:hypothetical protein
MIAPPGTIVRTPSAADISCTTGPFVSVSFYFKAIFVCYFLFWSLISALFSILVYVGSPIFIFAFIFL